MTNDESLTTLLSQLESISKSDGSEMDEADIASLLKQLDAAYFIYWQSSQALDKVEERADSLIAKMDEIIDESEVKE